jgi:DNA-binding NarL/FixJ family response regulator
LILSKSQSEKIRKQLCLTNRELEVIKLMFNEVESDKEIAEKLNVAEQTAKVFIQRIFNKTQRRKKISVLLKCIDILELQQKINQ